MKVLGVDESTELLSVRAEVDGLRFDFVAFRGGDFEVYDYPRRWGGVPRFVGYLPPTTAGKLFALLLRQRRPRFEGGYFFRGLFPRWKRTAAGPYCAGERADGRAWQRAEAVSPATPRWARCPLFRFGAPS